MRQLEYQINGVVKARRDGSYATQNNRLRMLFQAAGDLHDMGYRNLTLPGLKQKHIRALLANWKERGISIGTVKNRMAALRWLAKRTDRPHLIARDNDHYGIAHRTYVTNVSKAQELDHAKLELIADPHLKMSLLLQAEFGLRREESMKFSPSYADRGESIVLKASWCKGGRPRTIPIQNESQRAVLDEAHKLAGKGSLIPPQRRYIDQLRIYERKTSDAGMSKLHGLRHAFAQRLYSEFTGRDAPCLGGPRRRELTHSDRADDDIARLKISEMLGHSRIDIVAVYVGS